jgi:hypothetical protein
MKWGQQTPRQRQWKPGAEILFRGEPVRIELASARCGPALLLGGVRIEAPGSGPDFRPAIERHLRRLAASELTQRLLELARDHHVPVMRVAIRNQRTRWGSCSRRGTISLNWRLVQAPAFVRDYVMLHELAHFKEMNHSRRFWDEVARRCPAFLEAERWLKKHNHLLE